MQSKFVRPLFEEVRSGCDKPVWSRAVALTRDGKIAVTKVLPQEVACAVQPADRPAAFAVQLFFEDVDWHCSCHSDDDPCEHVAAAIIHMNNELSQGRDLVRHGGAGEVASGSPEESPTESRGAGLQLLEYHFHVESAKLRLLRKLPGQEDAIRGSLAAMTNRPECPVVPHQEDLKIDLALSQHRELTKACMKLVLKELAAIEEPRIFFGEKLLSVSSQAKGVRIKVTDTETGIRVEGEQDPDIDKVFENGAVLIKQQLHPLEIPATTPKEAEIVRNGKSFVRSEIPMVVAEILPSLDRKFEVLYAAKNLPRASYERPRLEILTASLPGREHTLRIEPRIAYGDPIQMRIVAGNVVQVGDRLPRRDKDAEYRLKDQLWQDLGLELDQARDLTGPAAVQMVARLKSWRLHTKQKGLLGLITGNGLDDFTEMEPLRPLFQTNGLDFQVAFGFDSGGSGSSKKKQHTIDAGTVFAAWAADQSYIRLPTGGVAPLPVDWLARYGPVIRDMLEAKRLREDSTGDAALPKSCLPLLAQVSQDLGLEVGPELLDWSERIQTLEDGGRSLDDDIPIPLECELRPYQKEGINWLLNLKEWGLGALLADDMGLGKTLQTLAVLEKKSLVVVPTSVLENWQREIRKFRPGLSVLIYHGAQRELSEVDVVLTTYSILRRDVELLRQTHWNTVVLDEAHVIKNPQSQAARAAWQLPADFRIALSGTPVENRLLDLWSQFRFVEPGFLGSYEYFRDSYSTPISQGDQACADRLKRKLLPFLLRRRKEDVATDLPPRTDVVRKVQLNEDETLLYESIKATTKKQVQEQLGDGKSVFAALEALLRLRQAACHPSLVPGRNAAQSSKLDELRELVGTAADQGSKVLVFSQWTSFLDLIEEALGAVDPDLLRIDGATKDRQAVVDAFQAEGGPSILIMSLKAGGVGLNLTAADHVFITDPWWNPAAEDQAADRAHRIGQTRPVVVHKLVAADTVEEQILELQNQKRQIAQEVVRAGQAASLTKDDLLNLFG